MFSIGDDSIAGASFAPRCVAPLFFEHGLDMGAFWPTSLISAARVIDNEPKEGSHYDLPIALTVMAAIGAIPLNARSMGLR